MKGIFSALLTPFDSNGNVITSGVKQLVDYNVETMQVDGLYVGGSTGQNFLLSIDEKKQIFKVVAENAKGKVSLIAQIGSNNIYEAVELGKYVTDLGYSAVSAVTPYYYKFSFSEILDYYKIITDAVDNKMIVYSIPFLTGTNLTVEQFEKLFSLKNVEGVKFTASDFFLLERIRNKFPDKLIYSGFDEMVFSASVLGLDGAIGSTYNVNGIRAKNIYKAALKGDIDTANKLQKESNDFISLILQYGVFQSLSTILKNKDIEMGLMRKPFAEISEEGKFKVLEIAKELGL